MEKLLNRICEIEHVKSGWIFTKKGSLDKHNIPLDSTTKNEIIKFLTDLIDFIENNIKKNEIEFIFSYGFFILKKIDDVWVVVWSGKENIPLLRLEVNVLLEEERSRKNNFLNKIKKFKIWK